MPTRTATPRAAPTSSVDGETSLAASQWEQLRGKFHCEAGVTNVWHVPAVRGKERIKVQGSVVHPNQKPLALMQLLVKSCSDPGDVVWEPFGGLCTASIAAVEAGRMAFAAEIKQAVYEQALQRIQRIQQVADDAPACLTTRKTLRIGMWSLRPITSPQLSLVVIGQQGECRTLALATVHLAVMCRSVCGARSRGPGLFDWKEPVDWIIGNPPYSILNAWLEHSFALAANVVYLLPIAKVFGSRKRLLMVSAYGGIVEVYAPWTGGLWASDLDGLVGPCISEEGMANRWPWLSSQAA